MIYSTSNDGCVVCYDIEAQIKSHTFKGVLNSNKHRGMKKSSKMLIADKMPGHVGPVLCVAVNQDGNQLATGGMDKVVRLWDLRKNTQVV